jgi:hypothetical protein
LPRRPPGDTPCISERQTDQDVEDPGEGTGGDEGDTRGGIQSDEDRHADPRETVAEGGVAMTGPAGAPQEELTAEERRRRGAE